MLNFCLFTKLLPRSEALEETKSYCIFSMPCGFCLSLSLVQESQKNSLTAGLIIRLPTVHYIQWSPWRRKWRQMTWQLIPRRLFPHAETETLSGPGEFDNGEGSVAHLFWVFQFWSKYHKMLKANLVLEVSPIPMQQLVMENHALAVSFSSSLWLVCGHSAAGRRTTVRCFPDDTTDFCARNFGKKKESSLLVRT